MLRLFRFAAKLAADWTLRREAASAALEAQARPKPQLANHASTRTTQLYDRRAEEVTLDEVERILVGFRITGFCLADIYP